MIRQRRAFAPCLLLMTLVGCQAPIGTISPDQRATLFFTITKATDPAATPAPGPDGVTVGGSGVSAGAGATPSTSPTAAPTATPYWTSSGGGSSGGGSAPTPTPTPTPIPSPTPTPVPTPTPTPEPAGMVSNTLDVGTAAISGKVLDPLHGNKAVAGARVTVTSRANAAQTAIIVTDAAGAYSLTLIALGSYDLTASKIDHTGAGTPLTVNLYLSGSVVSAANLVLVAP